jgi:hypothetical protein
MLSGNVNIFRGNSVLKHTWKEEDGTYNKVLYRSFYGPPEGIPKYVNIIKDGQYVGQYWNLKTLEEKEAFR